jgi:hypothetical protein
LNRKISQDLLEDKYDVAIVDDVRFINESKFFHSENWLVVRLNISEDLQKSRLQRTYEDWEVHWNNRGDSSEQEVPQIPMETLWLDLESVDSDSVAQTVFKELRYANA